MKRHRSLSSSSSGIEEEELHGSEFLRVRIPTEFGALKPGESVVHLDDEGFLTDENNPYPREDGSVARYPGGNARPVRMNDWEEPRGPEYKTQWFLRNDKVMKDPTMRFVRILAGITHARVESLVDEETHHRAIYDEEIKEWNKAERKRLMVGTEGKEKQLQSLEQRRQKLVTEKGALDWTRTVLQRLLGEMAIVEAISPVTTKVRDIVASVAMCSMLHAQRQFLEDMYTVFASGEDPVTNVRVHMDQFHDCFPVEMDDFVQHTLADPYLVAARRKIDIDFARQKQISRRDFQTFLRFITNYLFTRDEFAPERLKFFEVSTNGDFQRLPRTNQVDIRKLFSNTLAGLLHVHQIGMALRAMYISNGSSGGSILTESRTKIMQEMNERLRVLRQRRLVVGEADHTAEMNKLEEEIVKQQRKDAVNEKELLEELQRRPAVGQLDTFLKQPNAVMKSDDTSWRALYEPISGEGDDSLRMWFERDALKSFDALGNYDHQILYPKETSLSLLVHYHVQFIQSASVVDINGRSLVSGIDPGKLRAFCLFSLLLHKDDPLTSEIAGIVTYHTFILVKSYTGENAYIAKLFPDIVKRIVALDKIDIIITFSEFKDALANEEEIENVKDIGIEQLFNKFGPSVEFKDFSGFFKEHPEVFRPFFHGNKDDFYDLVTLHQPPTFHYAMPGGVGSNTRRVSKTAMAFACDTLIPALLGDPLIGLFLFLRGEHANLVVTNVNLKLLVDFTIKRAPPEYTLLRGDALVTAATDYLLAPMAILDTMLTNSAPMLTKAFSSPVLATFKAAVDTMEQDRIASTFLWKPHPGLKLLVYSRAWLNTLADVDETEIQKGIDELMIAIQKVEAELYRLSAGDQASIEDQQANVRNLYVPSVQWQMRPEFTGRITLSPPVVAALDEALQLIRDHVPSLGPHVTLDALMLSDIDSGLPGAFARLVAACLNQSQLTFPDTYNKDLQYRLDPKLRQDALLRMHGFSVREDPPGKFTVSRSGVPPPRQTGPSVSVYFW